MQGVGDIGCPAIIWERGFLLLVARNCSKAIGYLDP